jgi:hypothetical protein
MLTVVLLSLSKGHARYLAWELACPFRHERTHTAGQQLMNCSPMAALKSVVSNVGSIP